VRGLQFVLDHHEPYGAVVIDRYWNVIMSNREASRPIPAFSDLTLLTAQPVNLLRLVFHPLGLRQFVVNWDEVSRHLVLRVHRELVGPGQDDRATALLGELHGYPGFPLPLSHRDARDSSRGLHQVQLRLLVCKRDREAEQDEGNTHGSDNGTTP
jgi:hypothetical protein